MVDDGSTDGTSEVVREAAGTEARFSLVRLDRNHGKTSAMVDGAEAAGTPIISFLDADLIRLQPSHFEALLQPVLQNASGRSVGIFRSGRLPTDLAHRFFPVRSGQRCLRWHRFAQIYGLAGFRSGVDVALSLHTALYRVRMQQVVRRGVTHALKTEKAGRWRGLHHCLKMDCEIARTISRWLEGELRFKSRHLTRPAQGRREPWVGLDPRRVTEGIPPRARSQRD